MVKTVFYEKVGRKYVPVREYDSLLMESFPNGAHLVITYPGGRSTRYNINPNYAGLIAAGRVAEEAMTTAIRTASELAPRQTPITPAQQRAWKKLAKEFGDELCTLQGASAHDIAQAGINALLSEADVLYSNPAVRDAYEKFLFVCALAKQQEK
jgi:hypothetical protein